MPTPVRKRVTRMTVLPSTPVASVPSVESTDRDQVLAAIRERTPVSAKPIKKVVEKSAVPAAPSPAPTPAPVRLPSKEVKMKALVPTPIRDVKPKVVVPPVVKSAPKKRAPAPRAGPRSALVRIIVWALVTVLAVLVGFGVAIYGFAATDPVTLAVARIVPYPAALVDWTPLSYTTFHGDVVALGQFYQQQDQVTLGQGSVPTDSELRTMVTDRMIDDALVEAEANRRGISVSTTDVESAWQRFTNTLSSSDNPETFISNLYGWSVATFKDRVIRPALVREDLAEALAADDSFTANTEAAAVAQTTLDRVRAVGADFATIAAEVSDDESASLGGDLGYLVPGQMVPSIEQAVATLEPGNISTVVRSKYGFHIVKLEERLPATALSAESFRLRHILIEGETIGTWLSTERNDHRIFALVQ